MQKSVYFKIVGSRQIQETAEIVIELPFHNNWTPEKYIPLIQKEVEKQKGNATFIIDKIIPPKFTIEQLYSDKDCTTPFESSV